MSNHPKALGWLVRVNAASSVSMEGTIYQTYFITVRILDGCEIWQTSRRDNKVETCRLKCSGHMKRMVLQ